MGGKEREYGSEAQTSHSGCEEAPLGSGNIDRGEESAKPCSRSELPHVPVYFFITQGYIFFLSVLLLFCLY